MEVDLTEKEIRAITRAVQINIPFTWLMDRYLELFVAHRFNPEIGLDAAALEGHSPADFTRVAEALQRNGLRITLHGPFLDLSPGSPDPAVRELTCRRFQQVLDLIPVFKPLSLVCHAGYDRMRYKYDRDAWLERSAETWNWLGQGVKAAGSRLMLENVYERDPVEMVELFDRFDGDCIGFCLDIGHQSAFGRNHLARWLDILGPRIDQIHLHDNTGRSDEHLALGSGGIRIDLLFDYLFNRKEKNVLITLEPHEEAGLWESLAYLKAHETFVSIVKRQGTEGRRE